MITHAELPACLRPSQPATLVRMGKDNDGGYLVDSRDMDVSDCLIGLGIGIDWSFEKQFFQYREVDVIALDGSVGIGYFVQRLLEQMLRPWRVRRLLKRITMLCDYVTFFRGRRRHIVRYVGRSELAGSVSLGDVLTMASRLGAKSLFLKIDIEGSEYGLLEQLIGCSDITTGLIIEFHDCNTHMESICSFVQRYGLQLVHVHVNNSVPVDENLVIECTFSSSSDDRGSVSLPHPLDMPNTGLVDITIGFSPESEARHAPVSKIQ